MLAWSPPELRNQLTTVIAKHCNSRHYSYCHYGLSHSNLGKFLLSCELTTMLIDQTVELCLGGLKKRKIIFLYAHFQLYIYTIKYFTRELRIFLPFNHTFIKNLLFKTMFSWTNGYQTRALIAFKIFKLSSLIIIVLVFLIFVIEFFTSIFYYLVHLIYDDDLYSKSTFEVCKKTLFIIISLKRQ